MKGPIHLGPIEKGVQGANTYHAGTHRWGQYKGHKHKKGPIDIGCTDITLGIWGPPERGPRG